MPENAELCHSLNPPIMDNTLRSHTENGLCTITLNRPEVFNAFNRDMALALQAELSLCAGDDSIRAILLTGEGRAFCSGQDLAEATDPSGHSLDTILSEHYNPLVLAMRAMQKPIVVAVNGVAAGAGANLALCGDVVFAGHSAKFIQAFAGIGLIPDTGGTLTLPRLVGFAKASAWMMTGDRIGAEEAERHGMIYQAVADADLMAVATAAALKLASQPTKAFALTKQALNAVVFPDLKAQLELERRLQNIAGESHDFKEGVTAFLEKRNPQFKGH
jgi:2-(1,2-epoxy-1,2-dihydrophenyl)acetyl-CoA isomerase